jgi:hypothetical protein
MRREMMRDRQDSGGLQTVPAMCWCCGAPYPVAELVRLAARPEIAVCFGCGRFLHRQAIRI